MSQTFNIYCDESCHLEHDRQKVMVLGALWCPLEKTRAIAEHFRQLKSAHGLAADFEIKWTKVSPAKVTFYQAVLDYFFDEESLHFRALVAPKADLKHDAFPGQDHDGWYYRMLFTLLSPLLNPDNSHRIYLDLKDTQNARKASKLREVLCNDRYDSDRRLIQWIQPVRSHEVEQLQLCDLLIGALSYINRGLSGNSAKQALIKRIKLRSHYSLVRSTHVREPKFNVFHWHAREVFE
jgi:hypothetical protein